jgi:putative transcriptional regulator
MNRTQFQELADSLRQAVQIHRGKLKPGRVTKMDPVNIKRIRQQLSQSQSEFARMIGVSVATLQNWEQGRRRPEGPAQALLRVAAKNPKAVAAALSR